MRLSTSLSMLRATPGYWIFMAALRPSCRVAPCTCAQASHSPTASLGSRPAPKGMNSKAEWAAQRVLQGGPVHLLMSLIFTNSSGYGSATKGISSNPECAAYGVLQGSL